MNIIFPVSYTILNKDRIKTGRKGRFRHVVFIWLQGYRFGGTDILHRYACRADFPDIHSRHSRIRPYSLYGISLFVQVVILFLEVIL